MRFQAKLWLRTGAIAGSVTGVLAMLTAISFEKTKLGAVLLMVCAGVGSVIGNMVEKRKG